MKERTLVGHARSNQTAIKGQSPHDHCSPACLQPHATNHFAEHLHASAAKTDKTSTVQLQYRRQLDKQSV
jgi:hypothetical protein